VNTVNHRHDRVHHRTRRKQGLRTEAHAACDAADAAAHLPRHATCTAIRTRSSRQRDWITVVPLAGTSPGRDPPDGRDARTERRSTSSSARPPSGRRQYQSSPLLDAALQLQQSGSPSTRGRAAGRLAATPFPVAGGISIRHTANGAGASSTMAGLVTGMRPRRVADCDRDRGRPGWCPRPPERDRGGGLSFILGMRIPGFPTRSPGARAGACDSGTPTPAGNIRAGHGPPPGGAKPG